MRDEQRHGHGQRCGHDQREGRRQDGPEDQRGNVGEQAVAPGQLRRGRDDRRRRLRDQEEGHPRQNDEDQNTRSRAILDIAMPGMSGPDLQCELKLRRREIPIIFITASTDSTARPRLLELGAVECLFKPFSDTALLEAVNSALHPK